MPNMSPKKNEMPTQAPEVRAHNFNEVATGYSEETALDEALRCLNCPKMPCVSGCPVNIHIPEFIAKIRENDFEGAYQVIQQTSSLPAVCGRVCPQELQCESKCVRGIKGEPVGIGRLERFVADWHNAHSTEAPKAAPSNGHRVAVVGSGPSGLTCAGDLAKKGYKVTVYEALHTAGGVLVYGIPEFRLPKAIVQKEVDNLTAMGVDMETNTVIGKTLTIDELFEQGFEAVFVGSGAGLPNFMNIPGEAYKGVYSANEFLTRSNLMKAYKADPVTPIMKGGNVAVVGGGNVAVDCAKTAKRFGAAKVSMVCLEDRATMPASNNEIAETLEENIEINNSWGPKELKVDENGHVTAIVFKKCLRTIDPETKRFSPVYDEHETMELAADHVVFAIGQAIEWGGLLEGTKVEFWRGNYPVADPLTYQTAEPDIFVGGDVYHGPKFAIDAIEEGKCAAESLHRYVHKGADMKIGRNRRDFIMLDKDNISVSGYDHAGRQEAGMDESIPKHSFRDAHKTLTAEQVKIETARCLGCGASWVDPNKCIGCGVCTTRCVFDAIHLKRDHPECSKMMKAEDKVKGIIPMAGKRLGQTIVTKLGGKKD